MLWTTADLTFQVPAVLRIVHPPDTIGLTSAERILETLISYRARLTDHQGRQLLRFIVGEEEVEHLIVHFQASCGDPPFCYGPAQYRSHEI